MAKIRGKPVRPRSNDAREYRKILRSLVDAPVLRGIAAGLDLGTETLIALQQGQAFAMANVRAKLTAEGVDRLDTFFADLAGSHERRFVQAHRQALAISSLAVTLSQPEIRAAMERAARVNVELIKLIEQRHIPKVFAQVRELYATRPFDRQALAKLFAREWGYRDYPLRRIARDQVNKSIGDLNRIRQGQIGVTHYEWSTAGDNRVRDTHRANDGATFSWTDPPLATGHPGHDYQCRCVALAVLDDLVGE